MTTTPCTVLTAAAALWFGALALDAQDVTPPAKSGSKRFFKDDSVDFFGDKARRVAESKERASNESIWAEPVRQSDGSVSVYVPPRQVLEFLENPSEENARKYLQWKHERMVKLQAAMEALKKAAAEETPRKGPSQEEPVGNAKKGAERATPPAAATLLYFKKPGCPYCEYQDVIVADLAKRHPDWKITAVGPDDAELWKKHDVTATPTIVFVRPDGSAVTALRGLAFVEKLEAAAADTAQPKTAKIAKPKEEPREKSADR